MLDPRGQAVPLQPARHAAQSAISSRSAIRALPWREAGLAVTHVSTREPTCRHDPRDIATLLADHGAPARSATAAARGTSSRLSPPSRRTRSRKPTKSPMRSTAATCDDLKDELGDLLLQVVFHARMARGAGRVRFRRRGRGDLRQDGAPASACVRRRAASRMPRRRPRAWEEHKRREREAGRRRGRVRARRHRARPAGVAARGEAAEARGDASVSTGRTPTPVFDKLHEEIDEVRAEFAAVAADPTTRRRDRLEDEIGDVLFVCANLARHAQGRCRRARCAAPTPSSSAASGDGGDGRGRRRRAVGAALEAQDRYWDRAKAAESKAQPEDDDEPLRQLPRVLSVLPERARNRTSRRLHFIGSCGVLGCWRSRSCSGNRVVAAGALLCGYGFAWVGHFFFEKNRPATFKHPFYSFVGRLGDVQGHPDRQDPF